MDKVGGRKGCRKVGEEGREENQRRERQWS